MPIYKRRGRVNAPWFYQFEAPGSTRAKRIIIKKRGFKTKQQAIDGEAARRVEVAKEVALRGAPASETAPLPKTLGALIDEFFTRHSEKLAPKTLERYRESVQYIDTVLLAMPLDQITPLHLSREWDRLLKGGGHTRKGAARPMAAKTVRNIAGVVSSAYSRAIRWGLADRNPVQYSEPPVPRKNKRIALSPAQTELLRKAASGPWCIGTFLEMSDVTGARRGELLALQWSDLDNGRLTIARSLCQTKSGLKLKGTKSGNVRVIGLPATALASLKEHRKRQDVFRAQFATDYRADMDLIFANPDGTPLKPNSISATVSLLFRRLRIEKPKGGALHLFRHSHVSHLAANGVPLQVISERIGHSSARVTADVYSHFLRSADDEAVRTWEEYREKCRVLPCAATAPQGKM